MDWILISEAFVWKTIIITYLLKLHIFVLLGYLKNKNPFSRNKNLCFAFHDHYVLFFWQEKLLEKSFLTFKPFRLQNKNMKKKNLFCLKKKKRKKSEKLLSEIPKRRSYWIDTSSVAEILQDSPGGFLKNFYRSCEI